MTTEDMPENVKRVYDHLQGYFAKLELSPEELRKYIATLPPEEAYTQGIFAGFSLIGAFLQHTVKEDMQKLRDRPGDATKKLTAEFVATQTESYIEKVVLPMIKDGTILLWSAEQIQTKVKEG